VTLAYDVGDMFVETQCRIKRHTEQFDGVLELNVSEYQRRQFPGICQPVTAADEYQRRQFHLVYA